MDPGKGTGTGMGMGMGMGTGAAMATGADGLGVAEDACTGVAAGRRGACPLGAEVEAAAGAAAGGAEGGEVAALRPVGAASSSTMRRPSRHEESRQD